LSDHSANEKQSHTEEKPTDLNITLIKGMYSYVLHCDVFLTLYYITIAMTVYYMQYSPSQMVSGIYGSLLKTTG